MPASQRIFTIVPDAAALARMGRDPNAPQSKPPMTSKQAQKLYKQANRVPRLSKAEQRRREKEEQDSIRKEQEAQRARAARERKKLKEQQLREEKRKNGLPLVSVRPSQDTISRFIRAAPKRAISDVVEAEPEEGASDKENQPRGSLEAKRPRISAHLSQQTDAKRTPTPVPSEKQATPAGGFAPHDPRGDSFSGDDAAADRLASSQLIAEAMVATGARSKSPRSSPRVQSRPNSLPDREKTAKLDEVVEPAKMLTLTSARKALQETPARTTRSLQRATMSNSSRPNSPYAAPSRPNPAVKAGTPMAPPALPPRFKAPGTSAGSDARPRFLPKHLQTPVHHQKYARDTTVVGGEMSPPSSTQLFVLNYVDELFPSPSQQARELLEDEAPLSPALFFSTQDLALSSQDLRELESSTTTPSRVVGAKACPASPEREASRAGHDATQEEVVLVDRSPVGRSPPKKRFFTSSNREATNLVMENLAIEQSRRSFRLDELAREMKQQRQREREEEAAKEPGTSSISALEAQGSTHEDLPHMTVEPSRGRRQQGQHKGPIDCALPSTAGAAGVAHNQQPQMNPSQETDYGDIDLDDSEAVDILDPKSDYLDEDDFWAELL